MSNLPVVWISEDVAGDLGIGERDFQGRVMELNRMVYELLKHGQPRDVIVLPFFRKFPEVVQHIRERGITGPIIIYSRGEAMIMNLLDLASQGVVFMDSSRFSKPMVMGFIFFLRKSQEMVAQPDKVEAESRVRVAPPQNEREVRDLFRSVMSHRSRIVLTCQFRCNLPTLTVTCEVIQMVGEVETKLVLDKFDPPEFVGLYRNMANNKPLSGFVTLTNSADEDEALGFTLDVLNTVKGKVTTLLPGKVFEQKRKFFRVEPDKNAPITLYVLPDAGPTISFDISDISEGGMGFDIPYSGLEKGGEYIIGLALSATQLVLGRAVVVFKGQKSGELYTYGLSVKFNPTDMQHLRHYVYKRQAGILAAIRELEL